MSQCNPLDFESDKLNCETNNVAAKNSNSINTYLCNYQALVNTHT